MTQRDLRPVQSSVSTTWCQLPVACCCLLQVATANLIKDNWMTGFFDLFNAGEP